MGACHKPLELIHALSDILCQVGINVVVVGDGVRRSCPTLHHSGMLARNAKPRVVGHRGMTYDAGIPHMRHTQLTKVLEHRGREVGHLSTAVFLDGSILLTRRITVSIETRKDLIYNRFQEID